MMPSMQKGNCSWSLLAAVGILLVLFSVVHLFLFPLGPTLDYFGVRQAQTSCVPTYESTRGIGSVQHNVELDLDHQFPADLHNAVVYRGATWKAEMGRWLSGCETIVEEIHITEVRKIAGRPAEMIAVGKESAIMNWDNVDASMDLVFVTRQEQCAFVEKAQNIQIVLWQRRVSLRSRTTFQISLRKRTMMKEELLSGQNNCMALRADDMPHRSLEVVLCRGSDMMHEILVFIVDDHRGLRSSLALELYKKAYDHIVQQYSYWNQSSGKDHIWFFSWDEGACYAPKEIWTSMMLVHWGNTNSKHNHSTTAYEPDNWDSISPSRRGNHPCFDLKKDIVLPAWKQPDAYENGRPEA
ncbi:hypothetical protein Cgig2_027614 [Carnegiea gigantea]|uniref:Exostosin GT47 domain-containing protein n=1 Tax=Carnegiea gigantea TaxID=171969 RepID=A0A9Q1K652_9CARY|nr:hypothetical protein Cgig2_027614 [Carnegiea gigantea]